MAPVGSPIVPFVPKSSLSQPKLTCSAFLKDYYPHTIRVEPLAHFPVIRDLIVNLDDFIHKLKEVKTWLIPKEEKSVEAGRKCGV